MNSRDDAEYRRRLEAKLQPARVRSTLAFAALFQLTHEMLKSAVLDDVKGFYGYVGIDEGVWIPENGRAHYAEHVLTRAPGRPFEASLLWLQDAGVLSGGQVGQLQTIYAHRHALTHELAKYLIDPDLEPDYGLLIEALKTLREIVRTSPWCAAHDEIRDGAWVAELTGLMDLTGWPPGMRVVVRKERPHPGAQLRFEDVEGMRITAFVTNATRGQLADLELRHRRRARCEDRIRVAKDTGLNNLPLKSFAANQIWSPWPPRSPPGCRPSPCTTTPHDAGNPRPCGSGSSRSPRPWPARDDASGCTWPPAHRSPRSS